MRLILSWLWGTFSGESFQEATRTWVAVVHCTLGGRGSRPQAGPCVFTEPGRRTRHCQGWRTVASVRTELSPSTVHSTQGQVLGLRWVQVGCGNCTKGWRFCSICPLLDVISITQWVLQRTGSVAKSDAYHWVGVGGLPLPQALTENLLQSAVMMSHKHRCLPSSSQGSSQRHTMGAT